VIPFLIEGTRLIGDDMGLIRKSLAIGTVGVVNPNSKKQRVAKQTARNTRAAARHAKEQNRIARQQLEYQQSMLPPPPVLPVSTPPAATPAAAVPATVITVAEEIRKFANLKEEGLLTAEEFEAQKRRLLALHN